MRVACAEVIADTALAITARSVQIGAPPSADDAEARLIVEELHAALGRAAAASASAARTYLGTNRSQEPLSAAAHTLGGIDIGHGSPPPSRESRAPICVFAALSLTRPRPPSQLCASFLRTISDDAEAQVRMEVAKRADDMVVAFGAMFGVRQAFPALRKECAAAPLFSPPPTTLQTRPDCIAPWTDAPFRPNAMPLRCRTPTPTHAHAHAGRTNGAGCCRSTLRCTSR